MKRSKIAKIIEILFKVILVVGIICLPFIPKIYDVLKISYFHRFNIQTIYYKVLFYISYIVCLGIVFILNRMFGHIYKESPFDKKIVNYLKIVAVLFMVLSIVVLIKTIYMPTILSVGVIIVTFIISLCFYTLSQIFKSAVEYKNEVDFTI